MEGGEEDSKSKGISHGKNSTAYKQFGVEEGLYKRLEMLLRTQPAHVKSLDLTLCTNCTDTVFLKPVNLLIEKKKVIVRDVTEERQLRK